MEASSYDIQLSTVPHPPQASLVLLASVIEHSCIPNMSATPNIFLHELSISWSVYTPTVTYGSPCSETHWFAAIEQSEDESERNRFARRDWERSLGFWGLQKCSSSFNVLQLLKYYCRKSTALFQKTHHPFTPNQFRLALVLVTKEFWLRIVYLSIYCIVI